MKRRAKISILTPVWNGMPYIKECVTSVIDQKFTDWEMIIADNCSDDGTWEYLQSLDDMRIQVIRHDENIGLYRNLNFVCAKATSPICQILCADDYLTNTDALGDIYDHWAGLPDEVGISAFLGKRRNNTAFIDFERETIPATIGPGKAFLFFFVFYNFVGNLSNVGFRTAIIAQNNGFVLNMHYAGDCEFWSRASLDTGVAVLRKPLIFIRVHQNSVTNSASKKGERFYQFVEVYEANYQRLVALYPELSSKLSVYGAMSLMSNISPTQLLTGNWVNMLALEAAFKNVSFPPSKIIRWLVYFATFGGKAGRITFAKHLLNKVNAQSKVIVPE